MIERIPFGRTGHASSRVIFGAAALARMRQERADALLDTLLQFGINHIDTAAAYGDSELRLRPWLARHREHFFVASKTGERSLEGARDSIQRSLERLGVDRLDLIQLHNLVEEAEWQQALGPGGALEALIEARERGWVRFLGVTGHGTAAPRMHLRSLERFDFDAVLAPFNFAMRAQPAYAADFAALEARCRRDRVALQTIKSVARRRWQNGAAPRFSWYEPIRDPDALRRAVHDVLARPGLFLNSSSDATLLEPILRAASEPPEAPTEPELRADLERLAIEPLFVPGRDAI